MFDSGNVVGFVGPSAHGNEDMFGGDGGCLARGGGVDGDGVGTVEGSVASMTSTPAFFSTKFW